MNGKRLLIYSHDSYGLGHLRRCQTIANHLTAVHEDLAVLIVTGSPVVGSLPGASVIITGLSPTIAQTLVTIGVDLSKMNTIGDLQGGLEEAERLLGYRVTRTGVTDGS